MHEAENYSPTDNTTVIPEQKKLLITPSFTNNSSEVQKNILFPTMPETRKDLTTEEKEKVDMLWSKLLEEIPGTEVYESIIHEISDMDHTIIPYVQSRNKVELSRDEKYAMARIVNELATREDIDIVSDILSELESSQDKFAYESISVIKDKFLKLCKEVYEEDHYDIHLYPAYLHITSITNRYPMMFSPRDMKFLAKIREDHPDEKNDAIKNLAFHTDPLSREALVSAKGEIHDKFLLKLRKKTLEELSIEEQEEILHVLEANAIALNQLVGIDETSYLGNYPVYLIKKLTQSEIEPGEVSEKILQFCTELIGRNLPKFHELLALHKDIESATSRNIFNLVNILRMKGTKQQQLQASQFLIEHDDPSEFTLLDYCSPGELGDIHRTVLLHGSQVQRDKLYIHSENVLTDVRNRVEYVNSLLKISKPEDVTDKDLNTILIGMKEMFTKQLQKFGLDGNIIDEWNKNASHDRSDPVYSIVGVESVIRDNLNAIMYLEQFSSGESICKVLHDEFGLVNYARIPLDLLSKQYKTREERKKPEEEKKPYVVVVLPSVDHNGAYVNGQSMYYNLATQLKEQGIGIRFIEVGNTLDLMSKINHLRKDYGKISHMVIRGHGTEELGTKFGPEISRSPVKSPSQKQRETTEIANRGDLSKKEIQRKGFSALRLAFKENPTIIFSSCSAGVEEGIIAEMSSIYPEARFYGSAKDTALESITLKKGRNGEYLDPEYIEKNCERLYTGLV